MHKVCSEIVYDMPLVVLVMHAFTGCHSTNAFSAIEQESVIVH